MNNSINPIVAVVEYYDVCAIRNIKSFLVHDVTTLQNLVNFVTDSRNAVAHVSYIQDLKVSSK